VKFDDAEVVREFAVSKDATRVPANIIRRKGMKLEGTNPALLSAYGGYGISLGPRFIGSTARVWLDQGGVYAIANLRGGGGTARNGTRREISRASRTCLIVSLPRRST
jgi:prolyl oligopeptidase